MRFEMTIRTFACVSYSQKQADSDRVFLSHFSGYFVTCILCASFLTGARRYSRFRNCEGVRQFMNAVDRIVHVRPTNEMTETTTSRRVAKGNRIKVNRSLIEIRYTVELARGASVIASTLTQSSLMQAVGETMSSFVASNGRGDLDGFVEVLRDRLIRRNRTDAADTLANWRPFEPDRE